jgi:hypothetical protein
MQVEILLNDQFLQFFHYIQSDVRHMKSEHLSRHHLFQIGSKQYGIGLSVNVPIIPLFQL